MSLSTPVNKLIAKRKNHKLSRDTIARFLSVPVMTLARWEKGTATPSKENMAKIKNLVGIIELLERNKMSSKMRKKIQKQAGMKVEEK